MTETLFWKFLKKLLIDDHLKIYNYVKCELKKKKVWIKEIKNIKKIMV